MNKKSINILQGVLIAVAMLLVLIPILYVGFSGNGFSLLTSDILISVSILLCIGATALGMLKDPEKRSKKIGLIIGLLIVLISRWV